MLDKAAIHNLNFFYEKVRILMSALKKILTFYFIAFCALSGAGGFALCIESDGRANLEFSVDGNCATTGEENFGIYTEHCGPCLDIPISISNQEYREASAGNNKAFSNSGHVLSFESLTARNLNSLQSQKSRKNLQGHFIPAISAHRFDVIRA